MREAAAAARGDDRDADNIRGRLGKRQVKAGLGAVLVHRGEQDLACAALIDLLRPRDCVLSGRSAAAGHIYLKARGHLLVCARVDRDDNALTAVLFRRCVHQIGVFDRRGVDGDLVRTGAQDLAEIVHRADAAADRYRHENLAAGAAHDISDRVAVVARRGNVEKYDLVRALLRIEFCKLDRVSCVAQTDEIHALDHAAVLDVQTGDNAFCQHHSASLIAFARSSVPV